MALIRQVRQSTLTNKWAYVEYSDEDKSILIILGDKEFEDKLEANEWSKGFSIDSYKHENPYKQLMNNLLTKQNSLKLSLLKVEEEIEKLKKEYPDGEK